MKTAIFVLLVLGANAAGAKVHVGTASVPWDFSAFQNVIDYSGPWDVGVAITATTLAPALDPFVTANPPGSILVMPADVTFDELTQAPEDDSLYSGWLPFVPNRLYVIRTLEGHYAKAWFYMDYTFDYGYQDDGTNDLDTTVPVAERSWGAIKALFE